MIEKSFFKGGFARAEINFFLIFSIVWYYFTFANDIFSDSKGSKVNLRVKFKEGWCAKLCLTLSWRRSLSYRNQSIDLLRNGWKRLVFCNITKLGWFWKRVSRKKALYNSFLKSLQKQPYAVKCSSKWVFLEISQFSQENICAGVPLINFRPYSHFI